MVDGPQRVQQTLVIDGHCCHYLGCYDSALRTYDERIIRRVPIAMSTFASALRNPYDETIFCGFSSQKVLSSSPYWESICWGPQPKMGDRGSGSIYRSIIPSLQFSLQQSSF